MREPLESLVKQFYHLLVTAPVYGPGGGRKTMNVLVYGDSRESRAFVNVILQLSQMMSCYLTVQACVPDPARALAERLASAPALPKFVDVRLSDAPARREGAYASLVYYAMEDDAAVTDALLLEKIGQEDQFHYVIAATGEDERNRSIISHYLQASEGLFRSRFIAAVLEGGLRILDEDERYVPFSIPEEMERELERMAFNVHLVWAQGNDLNVADEWDRFREPYAHDSSFAFVASLRYKLADVGLTMDDPEAAAWAVAEAVRTRPDMVERLAEGEQRRWVLEKVLDGWTPVVDMTPGSGKANRQQYEAMIERGSLRDDAGRRHACILHTREGSSLEKLEQVRGFSWERRSEAEADLDELDRMSLEMHRCFGAKAAKIAPEGPEMARLEELIEGAAEGKTIRDPAGRAKRSMELFFFAAERICEGDRFQAMQFDLLKQRFLSDAANVPSLPAEEIAALTNALAMKLFPAVEWALKRDFKANNRALVRELPFILLYRSFRCLALPLAVSRTLNGINDCAFRNVASAVVILPARIRYVYHVTGACRAEILGRMLRASVSYLRKSGLNIPVEMVVTREEGESAGRACGSVLEQLRIAKTDGYVDSFTDGGALSAARAADLYVQGLTADDWLLDASASPFEAVADTAAFMRRIEEGGIPNFAFDAAEKRFSHNETCRYLETIHSRASLRVDDMFGLSGGSERREGDSYPDMALKRIVDKLWMIYTSEYPGGAIAYSDGARFYRISMYTYLSAAVAEAAKAQGFRGVRVRTEDVLRPFAGRPERARNYQELVRELVLAGLATAERGPDGHAAAFTVPDARTAEILSKAGELFEMHCYYEILETHYFDDVRWSYQFNWTEGGREAVDPEATVNELDLVVTKGFRSILIECKAVQQLSQDYYHKLNSIADMFGVHSAKVLLAYLYNQHDARAARLNEVMMDRGRQMDIQTIDIRGTGISAGEALKKIIQDMEMGG